MTLQDGVYRIATKIGDNHLHIGVSPEDVSAVNEGGVPVVAGPESSEVTVELHSLGEDRYHIYLMYHGKMVLGYGDNESGHRRKVIATPESGHTEWIIKQANEPEKYQIYTAQSQLHWSVAPNTPASPIDLLPTSSGGPIQEWKLEFINSQGS